MGVRINDIDFAVNPEWFAEGLYCTKWDWVERDITAKRFPVEGIFRQIVKNDLFIILYFILGIPAAHNRFVLQACKEVQRGPKTFTLDLWAREHYKSSIITAAEIIQRLLVNPEERIAILSYSQRASLKLFRQVKFVFENSAILKKCFPDILWEDPQTQAPKWSEDSGLWLRRKSAAKEASLEAWSLLEGMPTGAHFTHIVYDDVETDVTVNSPEIEQKLKDSFDLSLNLGAEGGTHRVVGTYYSHTGLLEYLRQKRRASDGEPVYTTRLKPATVDGTFTGKSVLLSEERLEALRSNLRMFAAQQLLNPSLQGVLKLDPSNLAEVDPIDIPKNLYKFMVVDPAGVSQRKDKQDSWAIIVVGVVPYRDDVGASDFYILDAIIEPMTDAEAMENIVKVFCRNGKILKLGVEKVGMTTAEVHVANALRSKGRNITVDNGGLVVLRPAGRKKEVRIESALQWPLVNGKIKLSTGVLNAYRERIRMEMEKFPVFHDDALDALSYAYDLIKDYKFGPRVLTDDAVPGWRTRWQERVHNKNGWMVV